MWNEEQYIHRAVRAAQEICEQLVERQGDRRLRDHHRRRRLHRPHRPNTPTSWCEVDTHIRVVHHQQNRKLGGSIKSGFAAATGDLVLYTDADLPFEMIELVRAIRVLRTYEADMVSAYRLDRTGEGPRRADLLLGLQLADPAVLRNPAAGHQLRVQAVPAHACSTRSRCPARGRSSTPNW